MAVGQARNDPKVAIAFILLGMACISVNDMLIKQLSGAYPLHQIILVRSAIGLAVSLVILQFEGGFAKLKTRRVSLHVLRGLLVVIGNLTFYAALAAIPLADATALYFVAPLFITLLSIPFLGEKVGVRRLAAVVVGFIGVLIALRPGFGGAGGPGLLVMLLPVVAAFAYACMSILTRRLGGASTASALAIYIQTTFIVVSLAFGLIAGDGRFAEGLESESLIFLLRPWVWPAEGDLIWFLLLGLISGIVGYSLSQAYRSADAATVAPFEYVALPLAILWGWLIFGELPDIWVSLGIVLIAGSGLFVFLRERQKQRQIASRSPLGRP